MPRGFFQKSELISSKPPISRIPKCGTCGLFKTCKSPKMPIGGKGRKKILIIGEAPGATEDEKNIQFCGKTGQLLEKTLLRYGIDMRRDCWTTNSLICRPIDNAKPTSRQIEFCQANLVNTVEQLNPEIIVPLGEAAVHSLLSWTWKEKVGDVSRWVGWHIPDQQLNAWICPAWHPSFIAREEERKDSVSKVIWRHHLSQMSKISGRPWENVPNYKKEVNVVLDSICVTKMIDSFIQEGGTAAFDFETNCLKPEWDQAEIIACSICWEGKVTISFPWTPSIVPPMRRFIQSGIRKIASNLKYEERWCRKFLGCGVENWFWCTMIGAHILDNRRETSSIKFQSYVMLGSPSYNQHIEPFMKGEGGSRFNRLARDVSTKDLLTYCGMDSILEYHVCLKQRKILGYSNE